MFMWNGPQAKDMACHRDTSKARACSNITPARPRFKACPTPADRPQKALVLGQGMSACSHGTAPGSWTWHAIVSRPRLGHAVDKLIQRAE